MITDDDDPVWRAAFTKVMAKGCRTDNERPTTAHFDLGFRRWREANNAYAAGDHKGALAFYRAALQHFNESVARDANEYRGICKAAIAHIEANGESNDSSAI